MLFYLPTKLNYELYNCVTILLPQGGIIFRLRHQTQSCDLRLRVRHGHKKLIIMHIRTFHINVFSALDQDADFV